MPDSSLTFETENTAHEIFAHNYLHLVAITFLFYDHLITSGNEIDYLWRRPKSQSAYWFFLNRYFAFLGNIAVTILGFTTLTPQSCRQYNLFRQLLLVFNQVLVCVLLTLRIYALYNRSSRILAYMVGSGAVLVAISCWALFGQKSAPAEQGSGCHIGLSSVTAIRLAGAWEALFVYDTILFCFTMAKTWKGRHEFAITRASLPIIYLIFRDGAIYFAVMALANLTNIMTFYFCGPFMRGGLSTFASAISVTMMSRLMLNLHETADAGLYSTTRTNITSTNMDMECHSPTTGVELDTLWSDDVQYSTAGHVQGFGPDGPTPPASFSLQAAPA